MLIPNCLFRVGGAGIVLSNRCPPAPPGLFCWRPLASSQSVPMQRESSCKCIQALSSQAPHEPVVNNLGDVTHQAVVDCMRRRTDRWRAKFELLHTVRTHLGASDANYGCVVQREDSTGKVRKGAVGLVCFSMSRTRSINSVGPFLLRLSTPVCFQQFPTPRLQGCRRCLCLALHRLVRL